MTIEKSTPPVYSFERVTSSVRTPNTNPLDSSQQLVQTSADPGSQPTRGFEFRNVETLSATVYSPVDGSGRSPTALADTSRFITSVDHGFELQLGWEYTGGPSPITLVPLLNAREVPIDFLPTAIMPDTQLRIFFREQPLAIDKETPVCQIIPASGLVTGDEPQVDTLEGTDEAKIRRGERWYDMHRTSSAETVELGQAPQFQFKDVCSER